MGSDAADLDVNADSEAPLLDVLLDGGIQFGKTVRQPHALHHIVGNVRIQLLGGRFLGGHVLLMDFRCGRGELHLQADTVRLRQFFLIVDGL